MLISAQHPPFLLLPTPPSTLRSDAFLLLSTLQEPQNPNPNPDQSPRAKERSHLSPQDSIFEPRRVEEEEEEGSAMASLSEEEESFEHTLLVVREVSVYKIPPRASSGGYKCGEWLQSDRIWSGRLRVVSCGDRCEIRLEDPGSGDLFATCFVPPGQRESAVETVLDSSRYFVLRIEDGRGKHAFVGLGFGERNEAFDFNVALSDHDKYVKREQDKDTAGGGDDADDGQIDIHPAVNRRLKEGETIRINVKNKPSAGSGMLSSGSASGGATAKPKASMLLAPPPGASGKPRSPLPPPPNDPAAARMNSGPNSGIKTLKEPAKRNSDAFSDLSAIQKSLPSSTDSGQTKSTGAGWAAF